MKNFFTYLFLISLCLILYCLGYLAVGIIERNPNVIVMQDSEYLWMKTYSLYNEDSCIYKYHQPIIYEGEVIKRKNNFVGIPGKGGYRVYKTYIRYNKNEEHIEKRRSYYNTHKEGDKVKIKVSFYPSYKLEVLN